MQALIESFPQQLQKAIEIGRAQRVSPPQYPIHNVVIAGLGGSGIGGSLVESMVLPHLRVPISVCKNYDIPAFVGKNTLFIASSFSGSTEETLIALSQVKEAKVACISSGGKLIEIAKEKGYDFVQIPNEAPCPRAFLGYSFVQILFLLKNYGLLQDDFEVCLEESVISLQEKKPLIHLEAKRLADIFYQDFPIIYADTRLGAAITRLQQQINENAKQLCHINIMPEMNHNELVGWGLEANRYKDIAVLLVKTAYDHPRTRLRMEVCQPIFEQKTDKVFSLYAEGESFIEQVLFLIHIFDWASFYLAEKNEVEAFPVEVITHLKNELGKVAI
ncbi:MAG: bifunctional phosphoglucose/phosphomannose isomerase [Raineya sp.]